MKIGAHGKQLLREAIRSHISCVPMDAVVPILTQYIVGLLENQTPELVACLEQEEEPKDLRRIIQDELAQDELALAERLRQPCFHCGKPSIQLTKDGVLHCGEVRCLNAYLER